MHHPGIRPAAPSCLETRRAEEVDAWDAGERERLLPLVALGQKLSQLYMGFNSSAPALTYLCVEGAPWRCAC